MSSSETPQKRPVAATTAILLTGLASVMAAFLIVFGILGKCSAANLAIFLGVLGVSAVLALAGTILGGVSYRLTRNRHARWSLLFTVLYCGLLIYLIQLIYQT